MNKIYAENEFTMTKALFLEGSDRVNRAHYGKTASRVLLVLALAWLALAAFTFSRRSDPTMLILELVVLLAVAWWLVFSLPRSRSKAAWRKVSEITGEESPRAIRFYGDRLEADTGERTITLPYEEIEETLHTRRLLILISREKTGVLIKKDAYTKESEEIVLGLLKNERPKE